MRELERALTLADVGEPLEPRHFSEHHSCAIQGGTGSVVCWGNDSDGQATPPDTVNGALGAATQIAAGARHTLAIVAVPEPSRGLLLAAGPGCLGVLCRVRGR